MSKKDTILKLMTTDIKDLIALANRLQNNPSYSRVLSIIKIMRQIALQQTQLLDDSALFLDDSEKTLQDLYQQLHTLLTENNRCTTWFTKIIARYCEDVPDLKQRLEHFIQHILGPIIKLSKREQGGRCSLVIEFPNQDMRNIFLSCSGIIEEEQTDAATDSIIIEGNTVSLPAFITKSQQLAVSLPTIATKERLLHILNLAKANLIVSNANECTFYLNDRRMHDTASKYHVAVVCPYFTEHYKIQYAAHMLAQASRDGTSFFSPTKLPVELTLKIASASSSSDAMSIDERAQIAYCNFNWP
ncbi:MULTISPECIES: hypothetical protein [Legionella]|nr:MULTISPECIES: hypothetical protein [Legionella]MBN9228904.1 hypothetical protein [Legionella steelei]OJW06936.1 MAG: hypothetical protein BGO44_04930 [Legionella sp. 39-23]